jgi:multiple sugar transport system substrate-binding protein
MQPTEIFQAPQAPTGAQTTTLPPAPPPGGTVPPDIAAMMPPQGGNKKKFILIGVGVLVLILVLFFVVRLLSSASGSKEDEKAELTYWGVYEDPKVMQVLIDDFHRQNPKITVKFSQQSPKGYRDRLVTRIRNGTGPDIFRYHNSWVPMLTGVLLPFSSDAVDPKEYEKTYYKVVSTDLVKNGGILGIPLSIDNLAMYTNDQIFSSQQLTPPTNWTEFAEVAGSLTTRIEADGPQKGQIQTAGAAIGTYDNITHAADLISLFLVQTRVDPKNIAESTDEAVQALDYYTLFARGDDDVQKVWDGTLDPSVVAFANGRTGIFFGYSWDIFTIRAINPSLGFSIHPVPQLASDNKKTIASYWVEGVSRNTKYPKATMKFMNYLNQKATQQKFYSENAKQRKSGSPYARADLANSLKDDQFLAPFIAQAPFAVSTPFIQDTQDNGLNATVNGYLKNAILEISDNTSGESAITTLDQGVKQAYAQYGK